MLLSVLCATLATLKTSGWIVFWNPDSPTRFVEQASKIDEAMVEWIGLDESGAPTRRKMGTPEQEKSVFQAAKRNHVRLFAMASNYAKGFDPARVCKVLASAESRHAHAVALVSIAKADGFGGIDLDYESLAAKDRDGFSLLVELCAEELHRAGLKLSVTVHAKDSEPGNWDGPKAQDWSRLGKAADVFRIMCYDFHFAGGEAGAIAPGAWVGRVLAYAKTVVPANKIETGLCGYGLDWNQKPAEELTYVDWLRKHRDLKSIDDSSGEISDGKAYFGGVESAKRKLKQTSDLGLRGVALWYIGSEEPGFWKLIGNRR